MCTYTRDDLASGTLREITYRCDGKDVGRFSIYTHCIMDMSIFVEPEFRNKNISRTMIRALLMEMGLEKAFRPEAFVYIDTDASENFWDHVGLAPNPNVEDRSTPEYGYEKRITMEDLYRFSGSRFSG
jgi:GNAT superfamily N-acetyltransferase